MKTTKKRDQGLGARGQGLALACAILLCLTCSLRAEEKTPLKPALDTLTLDDGSIMKGKLTKEEDGKIYFLLPDGETAVIEKTRVRRIESVQAPVLIAPGDVAVKPGATKDDGPAIGARDNAPKSLNMAWAKPRIDIINGLGALTPGVRQATLARLQDNKDEYLLVMLAMLAPNMKTDEWVRIGILRALLHMGPLNDEAARTLAYDSVHDPFPEARREACRTIRYLQDDRSLRDLMRYATLENNNALRQASANSLHEIDDNRGYGALVAAIPQPEVVANYGPGHGLDKPRFNIPSGPGGASIPVFTPSQSVTGVASNIGGPVVDFLKMVARKDMGNLPYGWLIWYREKIGDIGKDERDAYKEHRSARSQMGVGP